MTTATIELNDDEWELLFYSLWNSVGMDGLIAIDDQQKAYLGKEQDLLRKLYYILGRTEDISEALK